MTAALALAAIVASTLAFSPAGAAAPSAAAVAPSNTALPTITGTAKAGSQLTADPGTWSGTQPITFAYQWQRCNSSGASCSDISGASAQQYNLQSADVGNTVRAVVTATNADGSASENSAATGVIAAADTAPANTSPPTISGTVKEGSTLTASPGSWSGTSPITYSYQWQRCESNGSSCSNIAAGQTYKLVAADNGKRIRVVVTASNSAGTGTATSGLTDIAAPATTPPVLTKEPYMTGNTIEGATLTAIPGTWSGTPPITYTYQWLRCDTNAANCAVVAAGSTYKLTAADVGKRIRITVTAKNAAGSATRTSNPTVVVPAAGPAGQIRLPDGKTSIPVTSVTLPERLVASGIQFTPSRLTSRNQPLAVRVRVTDTRGYVVRDALVYIVGVPFNYLTRGAEVRTGQDGWATVTFAIQPAFPFRRGNLVVMFVRVRGTDSVLAGVSSRRLISVRVA